LTRGWDGRLVAAFLAPLPVVGADGFRVVGVDEGAEICRVTPGLMLEEPAGLSAGRGKGRDAASCGRDDPFACDSVRGVFIGATRSSSVALRLGGTEAGRDVVVGDGVGESPVIDASKSEICPSLASTASISKAITK
jgi:hypothetical protein